MSGWTISNVSASTRPLLLADVDANGESEETLFWQALTEMRLAETVNCLEGLVHVPHGVDVGARDVGVEAVGVLTSRVRHE